MNRLQLFIRRVAGLDDKLQAKPHCLGCSILREQLNYEREEKRELLNTLTELIKPKPIMQLPPSDLLQTRPAGLTFSRRRAEAERMDRITTQIRNNSPVAAKSDEEVKATDPVLAKEISALEKELDISEGQDNANDSNSHG